MKSISVSLFLIPIFLSAVFAQFEIQFPDDPYFVHCQVRTPYIEFKVSVRMLGWVGLGFGHYPSMAGADIFVGGIDNDNIPYYNDYHGLAGGNGRPLVDAINNWELNVEESSQNATHTHLTFSRLLKTNDEEEDIEVKDENIYLIFAYGYDDNFNNHAGARGYINLNLYTEAMTTSTPSDTTTAIYETTTQEWETTTREPIDFQCPEQNGNFPDPDDCTYFYVCDNWDAVGHLQCPDGLYFNPVINNCDFPWNVDCNTTTLFKKL